jgi:hypothetical protein
MKKFSLAFLTIFGLSGDCTDLIQIAVKSTNHTSIAQQTDTVVQIMAIETLNHVEC